MLPPADPREILLQYLYDLLDEPERGQVEHKLADDPAWQEALAEVRQQQGLFQEALQGHFPDVQFKAPASKPAPAAPPAMPLRPRLAGGSWKRWSIAASLVFVLLGAGAYFGIAGWVGHRREVADARARMEQANRSARELNDRLQTEQRQNQDEIRAMQEQVDRLVTDWNKERDSVRRTHEQNQVQIIINGPRSIQAGAKNEYQVEVKSLKKGLVAPKMPPLRAQVVDETTKKVVFDQKLDGLALHNIALPQDLAVQPGANLALVLQTEDDNGAPIRVREHLALSAPEYSSVLTTDRPMYRPGETVRFRSLTLDRFGLKPPPEEMHLQYTIFGPRNEVIFKKENNTQITLGEKRDMVLGPDGQPVRGIGAGEFQIPDSAAGGQYALEVSEGRGRFQTERRVFLVNKWQQPRLVKDVNFDRSSYGPGDTVTLYARMSRVEGGAPVIKAPVSLQARVDDTVLKDRDTHNTDGLGNAVFTFQLPKDMKRGDGSVSIEFRDGGVVETLVRPIPIVLNKLLVDFYPEGGNPIAGTVNRFYFQARTPLGKPADLAGRILDDAGAEVAKIQTLTDPKEPGINQGQGSFAITPKAGVKYHLAIDSPRGFDKEKFPLPAIKTEGVALNLPSGVFADGIDLKVTSPDKSRELLIGAYCRGKLIDHVSVQADQGKETAVTLRPAVGVGGVYRVTVFEKVQGPGGKDFIPLAERLIFRRPTQRLDFQVDNLKAAYAPGDRVELTIKAHNEKKEFAPAVLLVSVVDLGLIKLADEKTARSMPTHFMLTSEVRRPEDLEFADVLLGAHPKAAEALDLLLGVQGWRRFAEQEPARFREREPVAAARILAMDAAPMMAQAVPDQAAQVKIDQAYAPKFVATQKDWAQKEAAQQSNALKVANALNLAQNQTRQANAEIAASQARLDNFNAWMLRLGGAVLVVVLLGGAIFCMWCGARNMAVSKSAAPSFIVGGVLLGLLFIGSLAGTIYMMNPRRGDGELHDRILGARAVQPMAEPDMDIRDFAKNIEKKDMAPPPKAFMEPKNPEAKKEFAPMAKKDQPRLEIPAPPGLPKAAVKRRDGIPPEKMPLGELQGLAMPDPIQIVDLDPAAPWGPNGIQMEPGFPGRGGFGRNDQQQILRQQGRFKELLRGRLNRDVSLPELLPPGFVREYAHQHQGNPDNVRRDFTETLFWHPVLVLPEGKAQIAFDLSDSITRFQVAVSGHTLDGRIGSDNFEIVSRLPYSVEPKAPIEVTTSDQITLPVAVANDSAKDTTVNLSTVLQGLKLDGAGSQTLDLKAGKRGRVLFNLRAGEKPETATVRVLGAFSGLGNDNVERTFHIVPDGFPFVGGHSGLLEKSASHDINLPAALVPGTLECKLQLFPSTLAQLQKGLENMLREPGGCFEQSSSSNYPNVLILDYLKTTEQAAPQVEQRARGLLTSGYQKLTSFECIPPDQRDQRRGYEWFGQTAPPHEALTAYGLLQFKDMSKVYPVDQEMLKRTQKYLLDQRDGSGGFKRNARALDSFGRAPQHLTNAYIVWALTEVGTTDDLSKELDALLAQAKDEGKYGKDPYFLALVSLGCWNAGKAEDGLELLKKIRTHQQKDGRITGAATSITNSGGQGLDVETTALGLLAMLKANRPDMFNPAIVKGVEWLTAQRSGMGGFGNTQSTIMALKALIAFAKENPRQTQAGEVLVYLDDANEPRSIKSFTGKETETLTLVLPAEFLKAGKNRIRAEMKGENALPYTLSWSYQTLQPANPDKTPVELKANLAKTEAREGETVRLNVAVKNTSGKDQGMAVAIIGLPGGMNLPEDFLQLKNLAKLREDKEGKEQPGPISAWELRGRELVLYWRSLSKDATIDLDLDLVCRLPGVYRGPASRAYLYYDAEAKFWTEPLGVKIAAVE